MGSLNRLKKSVKKTFRKAGFQESPIVRLLEALHRLVHYLIKHRASGKIVDSMLIDIQVLIFQLATKYGTNMDSEWKKHWNEFKKKYIIKKPLKTELKAKIKLRK